MLLAQVRVFVTGASGHIGSAVVPELVQAGHEVTGLARSETSAAVKALGAEVRRGDTGDLDGLREAAASADAVIHLAFNHDIMVAGDMAGATAMDMATVQTFGDALAGTGKTFIGIGLGTAASANPRSAVAREIAGFAGRGNRSLLACCSHALPGSDIDASDTTNDARLALRRVPPSRRNPPDLVNHSFELLGFSCSRWWSHSLRTRSSYLRYQDAPRR